MRVLLVDDSDDILTLLSRVLARAGHELATASCGQQALAVSAAFLPQVVCLDLTLSDMDGYEVARRLRSELLMPEVRIVAISGSDIDWDRGRPAGIDEHLLKPVRVETVLRAIDPTRGK